MAGGGIELWASNAKTTLASDITNSATTLTVQTGKGALFPATTAPNYCYVTLDDGTNIEIVKVTGISTDTFTIVRGQGGTTGHAFAAATPTKVELRLTHLSLQSIRDIIRIRRPPQDLQTYGYGETGLSTIAMANLTVYARPFVNTDVQTFTAISLEVTTGGSSGSITRLGIYNDDGTGLPSTLLLDAGSVATTATGVKSITISQELGVGLYWLAAMCETQAPTVRSATSIIAGLGSNTNLGGGFTKGSQTGGAMPSPFPSTCVFAGQGLPRVYLKAS